MRNGWNASIYNESHRSIYRMHVPAASSTAPHKKPHTKETNAASILPVVDVVPTFQANPIQARLQQPPPAASSSRQQLAPGRQSPIGMRLCVSVSGSQYMYGMLSDMCSVTARRGGGNEALQQWLGRELARWIDRGSGAAAADMRLPLARRGRPQPSHSRQRGARDPQPRSKWLQLMRANPPADSIHVVVEAVTGWCTIELLWWRGEFGRIRSCMHPVWKKSVLYTPRRPR